MSAISAAISGVGVGSQGVAVAAGNVANLNSDGYRARRLQQADLAQGGVRATGLTESQEPLAPGGSNVDLATEAVALKTDGVAYKANLKVIQAEQEMLGTALDMKA
ncbi:flagellar basal body rod C-terminal domain-containing protein [Mesoterricola sediminis]|uniref:Flagellar basal-body/hook protein C-terminal domain-containing protein n=1 Tax=Mesoterricola sediminis TaxID=2927980 RepID=A0AA48KDI3_9BACT|nr:flagellar basal body rod C-terminal domain-containing protein [Mesoterricola sediminis]BDU76357.1 hypothetical protein METESE_13150 [Mesoterricola sediminis]